MSEIAIEIESLSVNYGNIKAVNNLNLQIPKGIILGMVGPNGAGKTTTIKCLTNLIDKYTGNIKIFSKSLKSNSLDIKKRMGVLYENTEELFLYLKGKEHLEVVGELYELEEKEKNIRIEELIEIFELTNHQNVLINHYSKGLKKRIAIAAVLLHNPEIYIFDEPFSGLDIRYINLMKKIMKKLKDKGKTVIISTHILSYIEELCDEIAIIDKGSIIQHGQTDNIRELIKNKIENTSSLSYLECLLENIIFKEGKNQFPSWI